MLTQDAQAFSTFDTSRLRPVSHKLPNVALSGALLCMRLMFVQDITVISRWCGSQVLEGYGDEAAPPEGWVCFVVDSGPG